MSGIELTTSGQKVGWSVSGYLESLEQGVGDLLKAKDKAEPRIEPKPEPKPDAVGQ